MLQEKLYTSPKEYLRIRIDTGGCVGFKYEFDITEEIDPEEDYIFNGNVVASDAVLELINDSTLDYIVEMIGEAFKIVDNPQADDGCSCGASFSTPDLSI